ncbi:MAG: hypothetical protein P9X24_10015 [Candidatus Hatepunaea meridiana]|nr:hypothetical protein [Candidatus Hatepunaea meridiana]
MSIKQQLLFCQELVQLVPYVSTDLRMVDVTAPNAQRCDLLIEGIWYRRLDAQYFVWIEKRVELARKAAQQGKRSDAALNSLLARYQEVKNWIDENISPENLKAARRLSDHNSYDLPPAALPPSQPVANQEIDAIRSQKKPESYLFPADGYWEHTVPIDPAVVKLVDTISNEAISKGWTEAALYQNRGHYPAGKWYGLVCILDKTDRIEKIDEQFIYIRIFKDSAVPSEGEIVKFRNLNYRGNGCENDNN